MAFVVVVAAVIVVVIIVVIKSVAAALKRGVQFVQTRHGTHKFCPHASLKWDGM
jgi:uncharacterized membrane protein YjgN (DUF898 family)